MEAKTKLKTIEISGMTGDECVQKVVAALKAVSGVQIDAVQVGKATVVCNYPLAIEAACKAITSAGYKARALGVPGAAPAATPAKSGSGTPAANAATGATPAKQPSAASQDMASEGAGGAIDDPASAQAKKELPGVSIPAKTRDVTSAAKA